MSASVAPDEESEGSSIPIDRRQAAIYTLPFFTLGVLNVAVTIWWGLELVWAVAMLPPVFFMCALVWIAFGTDFLSDR